MKEEAILEKIAQLECVNDQLLSELGSIDTLMRQVGFKNGLQTIKDTANEIRKNDPGQ